MKYFFIIMFTAFYACKSKPVKMQHEKDDIANAITDTSTVLCDSAKVPDFKNNLRIAKFKIKQKYIAYKDAAAKKFIEEACKQDSLFCGEIENRMRQVYGGQDGWSIMLSGYVFRQETALEEESASFFVLTVLKDDEPYHTEILQDLMGQIQVELNGMEINGEDIIIWGHAYPYFGDEYGKFKLTISDGAAWYEFECKRH